MNFDVGENMDAQLNLKKKDLHLLADFLLMVLFQLRLVVLKVKGR